MQLLTRLTDTYEGILPIWSDAGSGARENVSFWRPTPPLGFFMIGDYAYGNYEKPSSNAILTVSVQRHDPDETPILKPPVSYTRIWDDKGSGANRNGSLWQPNAPEGYIALGNIAMLNYEPAPQLGNYMCVREDYCVRATMDPDAIWDDKGSGSDSDCIVYRIVPENDQGVATECFHAQANHNPPEGPVWVLNASMVTQT